MPREQMLAGMSSTELNEWLALARIMPIGERAAEVRACRVMAAVMNASMGRRRDGRAWQAKDFMLDVDKADDVIVDDQQLLKVMQHADRT